MRGTKGVMEAMRVHARQKHKKERSEEMFLESESESEESEEEMGPGNDPFDFECLEPKECRAMESSLWELKSLVQHFEYKTSGHCFETVTHFRSNEPKVKRVEMNRCHMFEYRKLLNYYFVRNEWFTRNMKNSKERKQNKEEREEKKRYNVHEISVQREDHLFPQDSLFGDVFTL